MVIHSRELRRLNQVLEVIACYARKTSVQTLEVWRNETMLTFMLLLALLALAYLGALVVLRTSKRKMACRAAVGALFSLHVVLAIAGVVAVLYPKEMLRYEFPEGGTLVLRYSKTRGLLESIAGSGDLTYHIRNGEVSSNGTLYTWLDDWSDSEPEIIDSDNISVTVEDRQNQSRWLFSNQGEMKQIDF